MEQLSSLSYNVFKNLLTDDLIMERINFPLKSYNENVDQENLKAIYLQNEWHNLIETILYQDSIDKLLQKWQEIVKKMAYEAIPKRIGV